MRRWRATRPPPVVNPTGVAVPLKEVSYENLLICDGDLRHLGVDHPMWTDRGEATPAFASVHASQRLGINHVVGSKATSAFLEPPSYPPHVVPHALGQHVRKTGRQNA